MVMDQQVVKIALPVYAHLSNHEGDCKILHATLITDESAVSNDRQGT